MAAKSNSPYEDFVDQNGTAEEDIKPLEEWELGGPISDLGKHILRLKKPTSETGDQDGFDMEFNFIERSSEKDSFFGDYDSANKPFNRIKNRYSNVLPLEKTRVKLRKKRSDNGDETEDSDYVNANWVNGLIAGSERAYISTQGPLPETVEDFWRMVWETNSNVIAMLTKEMENDRLKCARYWPQEPTNAFTFQDLRVTLISESNTYNARLVHRQLELECFITEQKKEGGDATGSDNNNNNNKRVVHHFQYMDWPDHGLPESAEAFRALLHDVEKVRIGKTPIVVHCSAGIGRTGTFCTVHSTLEELNLQLSKRDGDRVPQFNVLNTVLKMREQRGGMVQTKEQYIFCYKALLEETLKLGLKQSQIDPHIL